MLTGLEELLAKIANTAQIHAQLGAIPGRPPQRQIAQPTSAQNLADIPGRPTPLRRGPAPVAPQSTPAPASAPAPAPRVQNTTSPTMHAAFVDRQNAAPAPAAAAPATPHAEVMQSAARGSSAQRMPHPAAAPSMSPETFAAVQAGARGATAGRQPIPGKPPAVEPLAPGGGKFWRYALPLGLAGAAGYGLMRGSQEDDRYKNLVNAPMSY